MKKIVLSIFILGWLCGAGFARAAATVTINEIMYDLKDLPDTDHEWVELYNSTSSAVSVQGWKFNDGASHTLNAPPANGGQGSLSIDPSGYVILSGNAAVYLADHPGFTGTVIDTVMSLNNTGAILSITDQNGALVDSITYTSSLGGNSDGKSLSRTGPDVLAPVTPTPGYQNDITIADPPPDNDPPDNPDTTTDTSTSGAVTSAGLFDSKITKYAPSSLKIVMPTKLTVGVPITFSIKGTGNWGEDLYYGTFVWSFGDGGVVTRSDVSEFTYIYLHPGEYVVYLEYYRYKYQPKPELIIRKTIKVLPSLVSITNVTGDGSIEISNNGNQEVDLSGWSITQGDLLFVFLNHLIVLPKDKIVLSKNVTHFNVTSSQSPVLIDPSGTPMETPKPVESKIKSSLASTKVVEKASISKEPVSATQTQKAPLQKTNTKNPASRSGMIYFGLGSVVLIAILSAIFLHPKKKEISSLFSEIEVVEKTDEND